MRHSTLLVAALLGGCGSPSETAGTHVLFDLTADLSGTGARPKAGLPSKAAFGSTRRLILSFWFQSPDQIQLMVP